jgi:hypothetical protein
MMRLGPQANPRHGEVWQRVCKAPGNNFKDNKEKKLMAVVAALQER